ncbi:MAG: DUF368 domain-containing protein, partial [Oscillospiraceae bacterium]|nr:DUF368 domain-containing protein [Oscillospiraceae bacterium]
LWKQAGKKGRKVRHLLVTALCFILGFYLLRFGFSAVSGNLPQTFFVWVLAGVLIGLGMLVPGLSPSNFLVYMNLYKPMVDAFKTIDFMVILPVLLGGGICVLLFSRIVDFLFSKYYSGMFHAMIGIVLASTVIIIPFGVEYRAAALLVCFLSLLVGAGLGYWMASLDDL